MLLPKLAAEADPAELRRRVRTALRTTRAAPRCLSITGKVCFRIAAHTVFDPSIAQTTQHLLGYDAVGRRLFLQTLRIMLAEMKKRYTNVRPRVLH